MHGAVAAPQASATRAGLDALREGGNAVDAALAAAVSLTVSYPNNCALGGDLIALVCRAGEPPIEINASGPAGADTDVQAVRAEHASMPVQGPQTVTVPGLIAGLDAVWSAGARRPWASAFETAIAQAEDGIAVVPSLAEALRLDAELLGADEGARGVFFADGRVLRSGEHLRQPALAATLRTLAQEGAAAFYAGELGDAFVRRLRELGAPLHRDDLAAFRPDVGAPLRVALADGRELVTSRPNTRGSCSRSSSTPRAKRARP